MVIQRHISKPSPSTSLWISLPKVEIVDEVGGTEYTIPGSYDGEEILDRKLKRIMDQNAAEATEDEIDITEDGE